MKMFKLFINLDKLSAEGNVQDELAQTLQDLSNEIRQYGMSKDSHIESPEGIVGRAFVVDHSREDE